MTICECVIDGYVHYIPNTMIEAYKEGFEEQGAPSLYIDRFYSALHYVEANHKHYVIHLKELFTNINLN